MTNGRLFFVFFFSSRRRHTRCSRDWSSDVCSSDLDFVMVDARVSAPGDWTAEDMQAVCARGTGIGADGIVFVGPGSHGGAARMIYYNADGSHAAMCGNAALCSTTLAVHLGVGAADGMDLETDAGTYSSRTEQEGRAE